MHKKYQRPKLLTRLYPALKYRNTRKSLHYLFILFVYSWRTIKRAKFFENIDISRPSADGVGVSRFGRRSARREYKISHPPASLNLACWTTPANLHLCLFICKSHKFCSWLQCFFLWFLFYSKIINNLIIIFALLFYH